MGNKGCFGDAGFLRVLRREYEQETGGEFFFIIIVLLVLMRSAGVSGKNQKR
jgi:hypothetical protein